MWRVGERPRFAKHVKNDSCRQHLITSSVRHIPINLTQIIDKYNREKMIEAIKEVVNPKVQLVVVTS